MASRGGVLVIAVSREDVPGRDRPPPGPAPGAYVRLSVADTGQGMDAATRAHAFEPYFTTKTPGLGSGLGLSVVHGIAIGLGGAVTLESAPGEGTAVSVWLATPPRCVPRGVFDARSRTARGHRSRRPARPPGGGRSSRRTRHLPDARARGLPRDRGGRRGGGARSIPGRPGGVRRRAHRPDLPRMCGDELTGALLALRPSLPIVICTGYSERLDEERARALGARALLAKPLDLRELTQALGDAIGTG